VCVCVCVWERVYICKERLRASCVDSGCVHGVEIESEIERGRERSQEREGE